MKLGRPPKFNTPEEMQEAVDAYFAKCEAGDEKVTVTGLAMAMDLTRETLCQYGKKDDFSDTVKKAKQRVEEKIESLLMYGGQPTGPIFNLKNNFGWRDKVEQEISGGLSLSSESDEDLKERAKRLAQDIGIDLDSV